jgi:hypothetical protein
MSPGFDDVLAWRIGLDQLPHHPAIVDSSELFKAGSVLLYDRSRERPYNARWKVVTITHFDAFYEWV